MPSIINRASKSSTHSTNNFISMLIVCLAVMAMPLSAGVAVVAGTWTGAGGDGKWTTAANWVGEIIPVSDTDVVITLDGTVVILPSGASITIASLTLGGGGGATETLQNKGVYFGAGFRLNVTGHIYVATDGYLDIRGTYYDEVSDSITVDTLFNHGTMTFDRGSIIVGVVENYGTIKNTVGDGYDYDNAIHGALTNNIDGAIDIYGGVDNDLARLTVDGNLSNAGRITLFTQSWESFSTWFTNAYLIVNAGSFTNTGTILDSSATHDRTQRVITAASFDNQGLIVAKAQNSINPLEFTTESVAGTFVNSSGGLIHAISDVKFYNVGTFTNSGTITIDTTATLALSGFEGAGAFVTENSELHGNGTLKLDGMELSLTRAFAETDSLSLELANSSTLTLEAPLTVERSLAVSGSGTLSAPSITNNGTLTVNAGTLTGPVTNNGTFSVTNGTITGAVSNVDSLHLGGDVAIAGTLTNQVGSDLVITGLGSVVDGDLINNGFIGLNAPATTSGTILTVTNGDLINNDGAYIVGAPGYDGINSSHLVANLVNHGNIESNFRLYIDGGVHINSASGTITVHPGSNTSNRIFYISDGAELTNEGTIDIDATATFNVYTDGRLVHNGDIIGEGTLSINNGWADLGEIFIHGRAGGPRLMLSNGTVVVDSLRIEDDLTLSKSSVDSFYVVHMINTDTLVIANATILGKFENHGALTVEGTANYISGPLTNMAGAFLGIHSFEYSQAWLTIDSSLTNAGILELKDLDGLSDNINLTVNKGWLTNTLTGIINNTSYSTWKTNVNNQGIINLNPITSLTWEKNPQLVINSGTIDVQGGDYFRINNLDSLVITETGLLRIASGAKMEAYGAYISGAFPSPDAKFIVAAGGELDLMGTVEWQYITLDPGPALQINGGQRVYLKSTRVATQAINNSGHLTLDNVSIAGDLINADTVVIGNYGVMADSSVTNLADGYMEASGWNSSTHTKITATNIFDNNGELVLTNSTADALGISISVDFGHMMNAGSILTQAGASTSLTMEHRLVGHLYNQGVVNIGAPTKLSWSGDDHANDGAYIVDTAFTIVGSSIFDNRATGIVSGRGVIDITDEGATFVNSGTIAPGGSPGILTFEGDLAQTSTGIIDVEIAGTEPGTGYDQLIVTGNMAMAGSLHANTVDIYSPPDMTFQVLSWGSSTGLFDEITANAAGTFLTPQYGADGLYLIASLTGSGDGKPFIASVGDLEAIEDTALVIVLRAFDPNEGTVLTFSAMVDTPAVDLTLVEDTLRLVPQLNWNGVANIKAMVSDGELSDTTSFAITFLPVQDAPLAFNLVAPGDSIVAINTTTLNTYLYFSWEESVDPDGDDMNYGVLFTDSLVVIPAQLTYGSTALGWSLNTIYEAMQTSGYLNIEGTWTAWATDGIDTVWAENGPRHLRINDHTLGINGRSGMPQVFALHPNYPNPFNPTTTITLDLPEESQVNLIIYDIMGQEVVRLVDEVRPAGYYHIRWSGRDAGDRQVATGTYIARLVTPEYTKAMKMLLLK